MIKKDEQKLINKIETLEQTIKTLDQIIKNLASRIRVLETCQVPDAPGPEKSPWTSWERPDLPKPYLNNNPPLPPPYPKNESMTQGAPIFKTN